ncbi:uncharacterized protein FOBCDRAFT_214980 [Fusarium oxysporum Fo47]|nr:uncharacterized protein FOBCDRAFT_214980 [Fusarium oxysporum Fo47]KAJ9426890.1 hypothetical protein QL093DRAFT_1196698 [Fusarium oxysporum]WJG34733.1 hypothetical protein FOBCDRAFT_214980 [Fusarium oxysporum Fo47]
MEGLLGSRMTEAPNLACLPAECFPREKSSHLAWRSRCRTLPTAGEQEGTLAAELRLAQEPMW